MEKIAIFFPQASREKTFLSFLDPPAPREQTTSLHKYWIMRGIRADTEGVPWGVQVRANRYFDSVLARDMLFAVTGCWRQKGGSKVQGYCFGKAFYGTVQPLRLEGPEVNLGLCGQGSC